MADTERKLSNGTGRIDFATEPSRYHHWKLSVDGDVATLLMELLLAMAFLSRVLEYPVNRWCNIVAGIVGTAFVAVTLGPKAPIVYWLLSSVEITCTLFIVWYAWTWRSETPLPE